MGHDNSAHPQDHAHGHGHGPESTGPAGAVVAVISVAFALLSLAGFFFAGH